MLSSRGGNTSHQYINSSSTSPPGDDTDDGEDEQLLLSSGAAIAVTVTDGTQARRRVISPAIPPSRHSGTLGRSLNDQYATVALSSSSTSSSHDHEPPVHTCCCLKFRATKNRKLHVAFCKALGITLLCLLCIFLFGFVLEPIMIDEDGWMDCLDAECTLVVPRPRLMNREPGESVLGKAYHRTDSSEAHAIQSPQWHDEWHERTVQDFLDRKKNQAETLAKLVRETDENDHAGVNVEKTLYSTDASIHTDISRSREIFDAEKLQLEKAYMNLVPWLPHHMRLGTTPKDVPANTPLPAAKTTKPILSRSMLDQTTAFLTETYPGCMWLRLWIVDATLYVHSFNTRKYSRDNSNAAFNAPTNVFGSESARLNHFLMMMLHVLSSSTSLRLAADIKFHDLPPQPTSASGSEDYFPDLDAIFLLGDAPCSNMTKSVVEYERVREWLRRNGGKGEYTEEAAEMFHQESFDGMTMLQVGEGALSKPKEVIMLQTEEAITSYAGPAAAAKGAAVLLTASIGDIPPAPSASSADSINPMFHSILSFQNGYGDENTRELLLLPRKMQTEMTRHEKIASDMLRGIYPRPPAIFSPVFTIRQPVSAIAPPPPEVFAHPVKPSSKEAHASTLGEPSQPSSFSLANHIWNIHQAMHSSPSLLLPDFTRWSQLLAMAEENNAAATGLIAPEHVNGESPLDAEKAEGGLDEESSTAAPDFGSSLPTIQALKLHQLHNKQIEALRAKKKIMLVLSPLPGILSPHDAALARKQLQDELDELEIEGLASMNVRDVNNMESAQEKGQPASGKQLTLQQRMLRKVHVLLKHRLVHAHDYIRVNTTHPQPTTVQQRKAKMDGQSMLQDIMTLLEDHYSDYSFLQEQRDFSEAEGTGFKLYSKESIVPPSCHLPLVVYEESAVNTHEDGGLHTTSSGGNVEPASSSTISLQPGSWAHWLWTCDYLVLREVQVLPRPITPLDEEPVEEQPKKAGKKSRKSKSKSLPKPPPPPPFLLSASNSFDEYWSVTYEPYKHYLPFVLSIGEVDGGAGETVLMTEEEREADRQLDELHAKNAAVHPHSHPVLTQLRASFRTRALQATIPSAFDTRAAVLHLLPLLHQLYATDWTLQLSAHSSHVHSVANMYAAKKGLHEEGEEHEDAAKAQMEAAGGAAAEAVRAAEKMEGQKTYAERHSCSSNFHTLADSLSCLWCVRASSRHWMRTVMSPEYIASYMRKLFTLYAHSLSQKPEKSEVEVATAGKRLTKIQTQSEVREWIKQVVFSTQGIED